MRTLPIAICIPAYNEEKNIGKLLAALSRQKTKHPVLAEEEAVEVYLMYYEKRKRS